MRLQLVGILVRLAMLQSLLEMRKEVDTCIKMIGHYDKCLKEVNGYTVNPKSRTNSKILIEINLLADIVLN